MDASEFLEGVYRLSGGLVERSGDVLTAVAPAGSGLPEEAEVWAGPPEACPPGAERLHPGHPLLEAGIRRALEGGQVGLRHVVVGTSRRSGLDDLARKTFGFRNARLRLGDARPANLPWATFHFHVTFLWDEKREDLVSVPVDLHTGARADLSRLEKAWLDPGGAPGADRQGLKAGMERARAFLEQDLAPRRAALEAQAARHAEVEEARLASYYGGLLDDLRRRLRSAAASRVAGLQAKHAQAEAEWTARRAEAQEKLRLRVRTRLSCVEVVDVPRILLPATLTAGKVEREVALSYSLLTHEFDPLCCEGCLGGTRVAWLCEAGHLACRDCRSECAGCGRPACHACPGESCGDCGARRCAGCGECVKACGRRSSEERPAVAPAPERQPRRAPAVAPSPVRREPDLVREIFADLLAEYRDLDDLLAPILRLVEERKLRAAGGEMASLEWRVTEEHEELRDRLRRVGSCLRSSSPSEARARLEKLRDSIRPKRQRVCACRFCQTVALVRQRLPEVKASPDFVEAVVSYLERRRGVIDSGGSSPAAWAAAAAWLHSKNTQAAVGRWFGVSGSMVSQRARELRGG